MDETKWVNVRIEGRYNDDHDPSRVMVNGIPLEELLHAYTAQGMRKGTIG